MSLPVVLAGARGHGRSHLRNIRRLEQSGLVRLVGVCELDPLSPAELEGFDAPEQSADLGELLDRTAARIAVVCTPIHTHTDLALTAAAHGVHTLLEKPTTASYPEFERLLAGLDKSGTASQIGFQSLGSHAVDAIRELVLDGAIGRVRGIGAAGAWVRDEAYYRRVPWAGRRSLDGRDVVDGVLTNPLAHAVATALRLDGSDRAEDISGIELEQFRANDIEADDTSCLRLRTARSTPVTVAVTLCAERNAEPYVVVHGTEGRITFWYKQDRVRVERTGREPAETVYGRTDLLENLVAHLDQGAELLVPPHRTGAFMRILEAVRTGPSPAPLPADAWYGADGSDGGTGPRRIVKGVDALVARSAENLATFAELGADWAARAATSPETTVLRLAGRPVADYVHRPRLPATLSPRPYLHPVRTLGGLVVTELRPADHAHHLGVSMAVPDVAGVNFWGGRTYVRDRGPVALDNHGVQEHTDWLETDTPGSRTQELSWTREGRELLSERRTIRTHALSADAWALDFTSTLTNVSGADLSIGSPATNGRPGAGYGGFFWRAPKEGAADPRPEVFTATASGEDAVHGSTAEWLALAGQGWTLVFAGGDEETRRDPWFVRTGQYPGVGSSLARERRLPLAAGAGLSRRIVTVVADGRLDRPAAAALAARAREVAAS
ncbi:DUF6807 family protein [Streptomyces niveus]|uniref:Uncharacterized protein n=1 Tax=Streptomyces niveus TaxID=193462 RepID=A0A1U9QZU8_STRNV|nr:hypothetical protein BBN63_29975 [Streptomyces niveus]